MIMSTSDMSDVAQEMVQVRRDLHKFAETAWCEFRTTSLIAAKLSEMGYEVLVGEEFLKDRGHIIGRNIDEAAQKKRALAQGADEVWLKRMGSYTGCLAVLDTAKPGPTVAVRIDIDCNDVGEAQVKGHKPYDMGFASVNEGWMHACGHDGHTAVGLALAKWLKHSEGLLSGRVKLIFQPAEEGVRGGYAVARGGHVEDVDYLLACHLGLGYPTGTIVGGMDGMLGSSKFDVLLKGVSAHAGGEPNKGRNALLAASAMALNLHAIAPHRDGVTRINVGVLKAGEGRNVVPAVAELKVETRGESKELAEYVYSRAMEVIQGAAAMYGVGVEVVSQGESICSDSDDSLAGLVISASEGMDGINNRLLKGKMPGSDDASWMMEAVRQRGGQATYIVVGSDLTAGHHNSRFDIDEKSLGIACELLAKTIMAISKNWK